jgi:hypothetical protein
MDATGWAVVVAIGAAIPSWIAVGAAWTKAGMADGRAERAEARAEELVQAAQDANVQYQRMADAMERRERAKEGSGGSLVASTQRGQQQVEFFIEHRKGSLYALRNFGPEEATNVKAVNVPEGLVWRDMPDGVTLGPMQSHQIFMTGTGQTPMVSELQISCDQLDKPVFVPVPPRF